MKETTNVYFYMSVLFWVAIIGLCLNIAGETMITNSTLYDNLDNHSKEYIDNFQLTYEEKFSDTFTSSVSNTSTQSILETENDTGTSIVTDVLGSIKYDQSLFEKVKLKIYSIYNTPSFFVLALGLPYNEFLPFVNLICWFFFIGLVYVILKTLGIGGA